MQNREREMKVMNLRIILWFFLLTLTQVSIAHENEDVETKNSRVEKVTTMNDHHAFVHPFLTHMGMPEGVGEVSTRITSVEQRINGESSGTYGYHIEAGIIDRLGIHLRNDAVKFNESSELMLQYAVLRSESGVNGISLIGELEYPTGPTTKTSKGAFGVSFAYVLVPLLAINSVTHYFPSNKMIEWEIAFVSKITEKIFPVLELSGEKMKDEKSIVNALAGLKFKIGNGHALGVGYQVGTTGVRDYNSRLLLQADLSF